MDLLPTPCKNDKSAYGGRFHPSLHKQLDVMSKDFVNQNAGLVRVRILPNPSSGKSMTKHEDEKSHENSMKKNNKGKSIKKDKEKSMEMKTLRELAATSVKSPQRKLSKREIIHVWWKVR